MSHPQPSTVEPKKEVRRARIVQIAPLAPGWHEDDWNRVVGIALVEIEDEDGRVWTDTYFLGADLTLCGAPDDIYFEAHYSSPGSSRLYAEYGGADWKPRP
jgi:hypothetical protein